MEAELLGEETVDGLDCVKICVRRWYDTSDPPSHQYLWLAKQRNFHMAQCRTSFIEKGNIGFPSSPEEIEHFRKMLTTTASRLTPEQLSALRKSLEDRSRLR